MTSSYSVAVFAGARLGRSAQFAQAAFDLGVALAYAEMTTLYGGTALGLMEQVALGSLSAGGRVEGVFPAILTPYNVQERLVPVHVVPTFAERKARFGQADAAIALPGGFGTLDEVFEMLVLAQFGKRMPVIILNIDGFYECLLAWLDHACAQEMISQADGDLLIPANSVAEAMATLIKHRSAQIGNGLKGGDA